MSEPARGDSRISVYLTGVTESDVGELAEAICDVLRDHGLANRDAFRSVLIAEAWDWPASDPETFIEEMRVAGGVIYLPDAGERH